MALKIRSDFKNFKYRSITVASFGLILVASVAHAGFEWIPPKPEAEPPPVIMQAPQPAPAVQKVQPQQPVIQQQAPAPAVQKQATPTMRMARPPAPAVVQEDAPFPPLLAPSPAEMDIMSAPQQPAPVIQKVTPLQAETMPAPAQEPVMKVKKMQAEKETIKFNEKPAPVAKAAPAPQQPAPVQEASAPPEPLPEPVIEKTPVAPPPPPKVVEKIMAPIKDTPIEKPSMAAAMEKIEKEQADAVAEAPRMAVEKMPEPKPEPKAAPEPVIEEVAEKSVEEPEAKPEMKAESEVRSDSKLPALDAKRAPLPDLNSGENVIGFGSDMPLALALQQVVPVGYALSFGESVNPGAKVSWTGGKGWEAVVQDMLAPLDLQADQRGKSIFVHSGQTSPKPAFSNNLANLTNDLGDEPIETESALAPEPLPEDDIVEKTSMGIEEDMVEDPSPAKLAINPMPLDSMGDSFDDDADLPEAAKMDEEAQALLNDIVDDAQNDNTSIVSRDVIKDPGMTADAQPAETKETVEWMDNTDKKPAKAASLDDVINEIQASDDMNKPDTAPEPMWEASKGDSLKDTLTNWAAKGDFELDWSAPQDYILGKDVEVDGEVDSALRALVVKGVSDNKAPRLRFVKKATMPGKTILAVDG